MSIKHKQHMPMGFLSFFGLLLGLYATQMGASPSPNLVELILQLKENQQKIESLQITYTPNPADKNKDNKLLQIVRDAYSEQDKNPTAALGHFNKAIEWADPELRPILQYFRAKVLFTLGKTNRAMQELEQIYKLKDFFSFWYEIDNFQIPQMLLKSYYVQGYYKKYKLLFSKLKKKINDRKTFSELEFLLSDIYLKEGHSQLYLESLEKLLSDYPLTKHSRVAFEILRKKECGNSYTFTESALQNLSKNMSLDTGMENFIRLQTMKLFGNSTLDDTLKRLGFLEKLRLRDDALRIAEDVYLHRFFQLNPQQQSELLLSLGDLNRKNGDLEKAINFFSLYRQSIDNKQGIVTASELIADSLRYAGYQNTASKYYGRIARLDSNQLFRWHHFFTTYLNEDYSEAASLYSRNYRRKNQYVPPRDQSFPLGVLYWQGKTFEKLKKTDKALHLYKDVLSGGDGIYSYFVLKMYPKILDTVPFQNLTQPNRVVSKNLGRKNANLTLLEGFEKLGLKKAAKLYLNRIDLKDVNGDSLGRLKEIATRLEEYDLARKIGRKIGLTVPRKNLGWKTLTHINHSIVDSWRVFYPLAYNEYVSTFSELLGVDRYLILSIMKKESLFRKEAVSWVGARGLMQIMPYTAAKIAERINDSQFNLDELNEPEVNIAYGVWYIKQLLSYYDDRTVFAIAAYNAGPQAVDVWIKRCTGCSVDEFIETIPYQETRNYVKYVVDNYIRYKRIYEKSESINILSLGTFPVSMTPKKDNLF